MATERLRNVKVCKQLAEEGPLSQLIHSPDYDIYVSSPVFESNFIQVTKHGEMISITNRPTMVTIGITSSEPCLPFPDILLVAENQWASSRGHNEMPQNAALQLTRMLPLRHVQMCIYNVSLRIIRFCILPNKVYYLQLHPDHPKSIFTLWCRLLDILKRDLTTTTKDPAIEYSLAPSDSPSRSISSAECAENQSILTRVSKKMSGVFSKISGNRPKKEEKQKRRMSFQTEAEEEIFNLSINLRISVYDMPLQ